MDQQQYENNEAASTIIKQQAGQSGADGHVYRRTRRVEIRVSPIERGQLGAMALAAGYNNLAQYLRETGLHAGKGVPPVAAYHEQLQWLQAINRIGNYIDQIALQLTHGREPDEEMLLYVMQIQEMAEQVWQEAKQEKGQSAEVV